MGSKTHRNYTPQKYKIFIHDGTPLYTFVKRYFDDEVRLRFKSFTNRLLYTCQRYDDCNDKR